jgi:hypothetical protein
MRLTGLLARRFSFVCWLALAFLPGCARASDSSATLTTCGVRIDVEFRGVPDTRAFTRGGGGGETESISRDDLLHWINEAATAVCGYYGEFPVRHFSLLVKMDGRPGVHSGTTFPRGEGFTRISMGPQTTVTDLKKDWMMTHEMIHLAFPSMAENHHWIEEGIATYVEPVARVQAGQLPAAEMWRQWVRDMPQGESQAGDRGLDQTHTWGRTYWGGALFCLLADVQIRETTGNRMGLQDALRAILRQGGVITEDWPIERALAVGDKATGTRVLEDLYRQMRDQPSPVDLPSLWKRLGVQSTRDSGIEFAANAPLARVREAITRPAAQAAGK